MSTGDIIGVTWLVGWGVVAALIFIVGVSGAVRAALSDTYDSYSWDAEEWVVYTIVGMLCAFAWPLALLAIPAGLIAAPQVVLVKRRQRLERKAEEQRDALRDAARLFDEDSDEYRLLMNAANEEQR